MSLVWIRGTHIYTTPLTEYPVYRWSRERNEMSTWIVNDNEHAASHASPHRHEGVFAEGVHSYNPPR